MDFSILFDPTVVAVLFQAVTAGILVSLDVTALTAFTVRNVNLRESPSSWAMLHASYHAGFLIVGIGLFHTLIVWLSGLFSFLAPAICVILEKLSLWLEQFVNPIAEVLRSIVDYLALHIDNVPEIAAAIVALVLCFLLYATKLSVAAGEQKGTEIGFAKHFERFGERHLAAAVVAMDMWYLTPTLRGVVKPLPPEQVAVFIIALFITVFLFVYFATKALSMFFQNKEELGRVAVVCFAVILLLIEPTGILYFAFYASGRSMNLVLEHHSGLVLISMMAVFLMVRGRFGNIVNHQYLDAETPK